MNQTQFNYTEYFMPHGHCVLWRPFPLWMHVGSDVLIALAYFAISSMILYFVAKRPDLIEKQIYILFAAFISLCGLCHAVAALNFWAAYYLTEGALKAATATVSILTAFVVLKQLPEVLKLPSPQMMTRIRAENVRLRKENEDLKK